MADAYMGEIRLLPYSYAPNGWERCNGQLMPIAQNPALYSLIGTIYGGDGRTTFGLPNLNNAVIVSAGQGPGLRAWNLNDAAGDQTVALTNAQTGPHNHLLQARISSSIPTGMGGTPAPSGGNGQMLSRALTHPATGSPQQVLIYDKPPDVPVNLAPSTVAPALGNGAGGADAHNNMMPGLPMDFCISTEGEYPSFD